MRKFLLLILALGAIAMPAGLKAQSVLRAGDTLEIRLGGVPAEEIAQFNAPYTVDESGMINIPYVGMVKASGLNANQVQKSIEGRLRSEGIYTHPTITISIQNNMRFITVGGAVRTPGRVVFTPDLTLLSAVNAAGGFNDFANRKKVRLMRGGKGSVFDCVDIMKNPQKDPPIVPGDQIDVPMSVFW